MFWRFRDCSQDFKGWGNKKDFSCQRKLDLNEYFVMKSSTLLFKVIQVIVRLINTRFSSFWSPQIKLAGVLNGGAYPRL